MHLDFFPNAIHRRLGGRSSCAGQRIAIAIVQQLLCSERLLLMDEPFSGLDLVMEAKVCKLVNKIACLDESNTIIVVTHDAAATVADHLRLMGRDRDTGSSIIPGARVQETYDLVVRDLHPGITNSTALLEFVREVKEGFRLYNPNRLAARLRRPICGRQATTRMGNGVSRAGTCG